MSLPPHREKDAKAEGRGPPETVKGTMAPFRILTTRLLKVRPDEVKEQQLLHDSTKAIRKSKKSGAQKSHGLFSRLTPSLKPTPKQNNKKAD